MGPFADQAAAQWQLYLDSGQSGGRGQSLVKEAGFRYNTLGTGYGVFLLGMMRSLTMDDAAAMVEHMTQREGTPSSSFAISDDAEGWQTTLDWTPQQEAYALLGLAGQPDIATEYRGWLTERIAGSPYRTRSVPFGALGATLADIWNVIAAISLPDSDKRIPPFSRVPQLMGT